MEEIRKSIIEKREKLSSDTVKRNSDIIADRLFSLCGIEDFDSYLVYRSFRGEVNTSSIISRLKALNKTVLYPMTAGERMFAVKAESEKFVKDRFGVDVPENFSIFDFPDVVIVPLVACDENLNRMGFGKGFYDRFLRDRNCLKIGVCHDFQVVEKLCPKEWDVPLDIIITEKRVIKRESNV